MTQVDTTVLKNKWVIKQLQHGSVHDDNTDLDWEQTEFEKGALISWSRALN